MSKTTIENIETKSDKLDTVLSNMSTKVINYENYQRITYVVGDSQIALTIWEDGTAWVSHSDLGARKKGEEVRTVGSKLSGTKRYPIETNIHGVDGNLNISDMRKKTEDFSTFRLLKIASKNQEFTNIVSIFGN